ncbi:nucleotidyltransferase family protein [Flavobacteriaceae bacterium]|nr:nucleotidyltransferase family protein [Flavobacteriaceae bacterium]
MNYKETLYFVAKSLTISLEEKNRDEIELMLKTTDIDWYAVVKVSTAHYVFPAMYCNLKRVDFLKYLPADLVDYMKHITNLNRDRNQQIIGQAQELNSLLLANNIIPIFLKGTGNLLAGIYDDIGERMVGDIDFIFSKEDYPKAITVLREFGYSEVEKKEYYPPDEKKHYRRLQKENNIAAIEIHSELLDIKKYTSEFNYNFVEKDSQLINGINVLSYANKLNLSIIANQINDNGFYFKTMALRNAYDVFLLSKKTNAKEAVYTLDKLSHPLNCFLAACYEVFNKVESIEYIKNAKTALYLRNFNKQFTKPVRGQSKRNKIYLFIKRIFYILYKSIIYKEYRIFLFKSVTDKNWYKEKLIQLGIKK